MLHVHAPCAKTGSERHLSVGDLGASFAPGALDGAASSFDGVRFVTMPKTGFKRATVTRLAHKSGEGFLIAPG